MEPRFDVFTTEQAAGILKITPAKMRWMLNDGQVRYARKLGGEWRIASRGIYELFNDPWPARESAGSVSPDAHRT